MSAQENSGQAKVENEIFIGCVGGNLSKDNALHEVLPQTPFQRFLIFILFIIFC
jgi:hypothetical protein